ncbi:8709_t:CDS:2, partial [Scutellospora calospora]
SSTRLVKLIVEIKKLKIPHESKQQKKQKNDLKQYSCKNSSEPEETNKICK